MQASEKGKNVKTIILISIPCPSPLVEGVVPSGNAWVLELARRQRMNTDVRKNVFSVLMTSEVSHMTGPVIM